MDENILTLAESQPILRIASIDYFNILLPFPWGEFDYSTTLIRKSIKIVVLAGNYSVNWDTNNQFFSKYQFSWKTISRRKCWFPHVMKKLFFYVGKQFYISKQCNTVHLFLIQLHSLHFHNSNSITSHFLIRHE